MNQVFAMALVLSVLVAGCASVDEPAVERPSLSADETAATPAAVTEDARAPPVAAARALFLHPDGSLAVEPPAAAGERAVEVPVNGPIWDDGDYPTWEGALPVDLELDGTLAVHVWGTTSSAALAAYNVPLFMGIPALEFQVSTEERSLDAGLSGPAYMLAGEVVDFTGELVVDEPWRIPAGTPIVVNVQVYYTHAWAVEEFRVLMGPDRPSGAS